MNFRTIRVSLGATIALPGYNSARIDYSEEDLVPDGADLDEARERLYTRVDEYLAKKVKEVQDESNSL